MLLEPRGNMLGKFHGSTISSNLGFSYSLEDLVRYYSRYCRLMEFWQAEMGGLIYSVNYERLTENPEMETRADTILGSGLGRRVFIAAGQ